MSDNTVPDSTAHASDFFAWSQDQARLLRRLPGLCPDLPNALDLENVAEEIEDLGRAELAALESQIRNIFVHLIKACSDPASRAIPHWRTEATIFHAELVQRFLPSMRQRIDLQQTWRLALRIAHAALREHGREIGAHMPADCPFRLDELVAEDFDFDQAAARLAIQRNADRTS